MTTELRTLEIYTQAEQLAYEQAKAAGSSAEQCRQAGQANMARADECHATQDHVGTHHHAGLAEGFFRRYRELAALERPQRHRVRTVALGTLMGLAACVPGLTAGASTPAHVASTTQQAATAVLFATHLGCRYGAYASAWQTSPVHIHLVTGCVTATYHAGDLVEHWLSDHGVTVYITHTH